MCRGIYFSSEVAAKGGSRDGFFPSYSNFTNEAKVGAGGATAMNYLQCDLEHGL